ncbi:MAG: ABC transporter permease [Anaerolineales bacterium]|nr:ABC transporter permease [Anaerolineales bacterium]
MIAPRWKKVLRDLWGNKMRTILVVLSIAVGVFAVGAVTHTFTIVSQELAITYPKANPAAATIYTEAFDDDLVQMVRRMPGVGEVEARTMTVVQMKVGDEWKSLYLFAISDFDDIRINKVKPQGAYEPAPNFHAERGTWPPGEHAVALERSSLLVPGFVPAKLQVGDKVQVRYSTNSPVRDLQVTGLAHESTFYPAPFLNSAYGYITFDTLEWLTGARRPDTLYLTVSENKTDKAHITRVAEQVRNKIEAGGRSVSIQVPEPAKHPLQDIFSGLLLLLNILGFASLFLSGFLVVNTISALLAQQIRQIGIMKAIGARRRQIVALYLVTVLLYGIFALAIAIPSAAFVAGQLSLYLAGFINVDFPDFSIPPGILILEIAIGLLLPLLAAIFPIWSGTRVTVREAISDYGISTKAEGRRIKDEGGKKRFALFTSKISSFILHTSSFLSRPTRLSLRNTFRRKSRLALTLLTLILGGTIFIAVLSVHASMNQTLEDVFKNWQFDILLPFEKSYRTDVIEEIAKQMPGVVNVESWGYTSARRLRPDDSESESLTLFAPPAQTAMVQPEIIEGRWLVPGDENAIVVSTDTTRAEKDLKLGDEFTLKIAGRKTTWRIVGIIRVVGFRGGIGVAYANYPYYARVIGQVGRAGSVQLVTEKHDTASQLKLKKALEDRYLLAGLRASSGGITSGQIRDNNEMFFNIITALLMAMAFLMAIVGGLGLMGTMSLNVLERTREIGVMRAVGASNGAVRGVILTEGITIGLLSAGIAILFSFPLGQALSALVGEALFQLPLSYAISINGIIMWLVIVVILSMLASFLPAYNASRLTVREILAYE